jgi:REP element-mobilizing transposase RayT
MNFFYRRSIRLKNYDYSQQGAYFVTICTQYRQCLWGQIKQDQILLNNLGSVALQCWLEIPTHFPSVELDVFVIMPNHLHGILWIKESLNQEDKYNQYQKVVKGSIPSIVRSFKAAVTKKINQICQQKGASLIWQRNYHEKIIKDEEMLNNIREYILNNPRNWEKDTEYSSSNNIILDLPF